MSPIGYAGPRDALEKVVGEVIEDEGDISAKESAKSKWAELGSRDLIAPSSRSGFEEETITRSLLPIRGSEAQLMGGTMTTHSLCGGTPQPLWAVPRQREGEDADFDPAAIAEIQVSA
ncbi:MAG: hypothetical protein ABI600_13570 [Luteolibacter sp.]